ncbi:aminoacyl-tRNA deacylase [Halorubrum rubrum]|uniref:Aminoacyl-tRNA deacylase n=1 Tax=Halorubrum rubrum TaxID=1126240 RepID=A0ABD5QYJ3_9EURY|nr:YbaK/EbsC family protein [Halorubrum rubrum]
MVRTEITDYLRERGIEYELLEHSDDAVTSEKAAKLRDVPLAEMVKSMVFLDDDREVVVAIVPAERKVDLGSLREIADIDSLKFADEEVIEDDLGYTIGAIPPFFPGRDCPIYMDADIFRNDEVNFSSGRPDAGIEVETRAFRTVLDEFDAERGSIGTASD